MYTKDAEHDLNTKTTEICSNSNSLWFYRECNGESGTTRLLYGVELALGDD